MASSYFDQIVSSKPGISSAMDQLGVGSTYLSANPSVAGLMDQLGGNPSVPDTSAPKTSPYFDSILNAKPGIAGAMDQLGLGGTNPLLAAAAKPAAARTASDPLTQTALDNALMQSPEPPYYTGAQVQLIIGTTFMLNAIDFTWNNSYEHQPYFGYCSKEYDYVFEGKTIVQGALVLNLLDNRLLDLVCDKAYPGGVDAAAKMRQALSGGKEYAGIAVDRLVAAQAASGSGANLPAFLDSIQQTSVARDPGTPAKGTPPGRLALETLRWLKSQERFGIDIRCNIGDPTEIGMNWSARRASVGETLSGVIFTGENRALRVSTEVIVQAYTFFARRVDRCTDAPLPAPPLSKPNPAAVGATSGAASAVSPLPPTAR